jgi:hypothetical protein
MLYISGCSVGQFFLEKPPKINFYPERKRKKEEGRAGVIHTRRGRKEGKRGNLV